MGFNVFANKTWIMSAKYFCGFECYKFATTDLKKLSDNVIMATKNLTKTEKSSFSIVKEHSYMIYDNGNAFFGPNEYANMEMEQDMYLSSELEVDRVSFLRHQNHVPIVLMSDSVWFYEDLKSFETKLFSKYADVSNIEVTTNHTKIEISSNCEFKTTSFCHQLNTMMQCGDILILESKFFSDQGIFFDCAEKTFFSPGEIKINSTHVSMQGFKILIKP